MPPSTDWPFDEAGNEAVITVRGIVDGNVPTLLVTRDPDDGCRQSPTGREFEVSDGRIVTLKSMFDLDPGLAELAGLPLGWRAWRSRLGGPWQRCIERGD